MNSAGFLIFLLGLAIIEATFNLRLSLAGVLILLNFVPIRSLIWWAFALGFVLDLLSGTFLGVNSAILIAAVVIWYFGRQLFWPNLTYENFAKEITFLVIFQVLATSRIYDFFYNLANFGVPAFDFKLTLVPFEIILTLILIPAIFYLCQKWLSKQLELKF